MSSAPSDPSDKSPGLPVGRPRERRVRNSKLAWSGFLLTVVGLLIAVVLWRYPFSNASNSSSEPLTVVNIVDSNSYSGSIKHVDFFCALYSVRSNRADAHLCLEPVGKVSFVLDPCFEDGSSGGHDVVLCPILGPRGPKPVHYERFAVTAVGSEYSDTVAPQPRVGTEEALADDNPWAIELGGQAAGVICNLSVINDTGELASLPTSYDCGTGALLTLSTSGFLSGSDMRVVAYRPEENGAATDLDRSGAIWTVLYGGKGMSSTHSVPIVEAWF